MSPPHHLRRRRKKEDADVRIGKEVTSQTWRQNQAVFMYYTHSHNGGRVDLFTHKATAIVRLHCYSRFIFCYVIIVIVFGNKAWML